MGGGSGGGGGGDSTTTYRFAPYIESQHSSFLDLVKTKRNAIINESPYSSYTDFDIEVGFFGTGYALASFPSLYDMYGKFLAGLDIEAVFNEIFEDTINGTVISNEIAAESSRMDDDINENSLPRFETGMRDMNAVMSSSFLVGRSLIETAKTKALSRYSADLKVRLLPLVTDRWKAHLEWNRSVIATYAQILKLYIMSEIDVDNHNFEVHAKDLLWPFTVLQYNGAALGALTGAKDVSTDVAGASTSQRLLGGAMAGAAAGSMIAPGWGTAIGAAAGGLMGLFS